MTNKIRATVIYFEYFYEIRNIFRNIAKNNQLTF